MKRRISAIFLVIALLVSLIPTVVIAADTFKLNPVASVESVSVENPIAKGKTVTITLNYVNWPEKVDTLQIDMTYDQTKFSCKPAGVKAGSVPADPYTEEAPSFTKNAANGKVSAGYAYYIAGEATASGTIMTVTFTALEDITSSCEFGIVVKTLVIGGVSSTDALETPEKLTIAGGVTPPQHTCTLTKVPAKAATCTEDGNIEYYQCSDTTCGKLYKDAAGTQEITKADTVIKAGHKYGDLIPEVSATCGKDGVKAHYECSVCHKNFGTDYAELDSLVIPATGEHDWEIIKGTDGSSTHTLKCKSCNKTVDEVHADRPGDVSNKWESDKDNHWKVYGCGTIMDKAAHTWDKGVVTKEATCTEPGEKTFTCGVCQEKKTEPINATGHKYETTWTTDDTSHWHKCANCDVTTDKADHTFDTNNCAENRTCTGCGYVKPAGQHSWNDGEVTTPATCTTDGVKTYTCKVCSETKTEPIKAPGHSLTKVEAVAATCTEGGNNEYYTCSVCKKVFKADKTTETTVADETLAALGHKLTKTPAVTPTCAAGGNNEYWTCSVCHKVFKADKTTETTVAAETLAKDPANHTGGTEQRGAVAASCMTAGRTADTYCKGCGKLTEPGAFIPPTGVHNYKDGVCTTCGNKQPADNATIKAAIEKVVADVKEAVEEVLDKAIKNETDANTKKILEKLKGYVSGSSRSKLQAVYNVTMSLNGQDLDKGDSLADGQNVTIAISEETYNALRSGAKIVESYLDKDGNAQTREINATLKKVGDGYTVTFAADKTAAYGLMTRTSSGGSGSGSSYTSGQSFTTDLPADSINRVTVNGKKLDSKYYTVSSNGSGSIVTLTDAYLATLKAGKYTVKIENKTHVSTGTFTIKADGTLSSPKTADAGIALYAMLAVSSLMGTAVVSKKRRKA